MTASPRVSVVLPTFNRWTTLRRAIASVTAQSFGDLELIVVDDGSDIPADDFSAGIDDVRVRFIRRQKRGGASAARNTGVAQARGEVLAFIDSDDEWLPSKLARQLRRLDSPDSPRLVTCGLLRRETGGVVRYLPGSAWDGAATTFRASILRRNIALTTGWCLKRTAFERVGNFDEALRSLEDWEWLIRFSRDGVAVLEPDVLAVVHESRDSLSLDDGRYIDSLRHIIERHRPFLTASERANLLYVLGKKYCLHGSMARGREQFQQALDATPRDRRAALALALSFLGKPAFATAFRLARLLRPPPT